MIGALDVPAVGGTVRWVETGDGGPVRVYLHGLGAMGAPYYASVVGHAPLRDARNLLVDLPGHGLSDRPDGFDHTIEAHADAVAAVVAHVTAGPVDVVAHSFGGAVASLLAHRHPGLVRSLVLVDPNLDPNVPEPGAASSRGIAAYAEDDFVAAPDTEIEALVGTDWWATMRLAGRRALHRTSVSLIAPRTPTFRSAVEGLTVPRTLLFPADEAPYPGEAGLRASGVRLVPVPDTGHNVMLDNPTGFVDAVATALVRP